MSTQRGKQESFSQYSQNVYENPLFSQTAQIVLITKRRSNLGATAARAIFFGSKLSARESLNNF